MAANEPIDTSAAPGSVEQSCLEIELCDAESCGELVGTIDELRDHWTARDRVRPFHTLGTASYLDVRRLDTSDYYHRSAVTNLLLLDHFSDLFAKVCRAVDESTGTRCELTKRQAVPGFHIFGAHPDYLKPVGSIHADLQHQPLTWDFDTDEQQCEAFGQVLSLTLPLELPRDGGGLNLWDFGPETKPVGVFGWDEGAFVKAHPPRLVEYQCGRLVIHRGQQFHQIAPLRSYHEADRRISLQGHAILIDGAYELYW